jgi:hypothetical protein
MKWFDDPNLQYGSTGTAKALVRANYRIHHLETLLKKKNEKLARLHRKLRMTKLEFRFKSALKIIKK